jgi:hypothetical protein
MATVNLGRIKPTWQGTWSSSTSYVADDIVYYNNHAWIAVATNTNSAPSDGNSNWDKMANGASIPDNGTNGQVLTADGSNGYAWETLPPSDDASALTQGTLDNARLDSTVQNARVIASSNLGGGSHTAGYIRYENGLIMQWGYHHIGGASDGTISYPIAFPNAVWNVQLTLTNDNNNGNASLDVRNHPNTSNFSWWQNNNGQTARHVTFIAIGR